jgi:hypothetical protein
MGQSSGKRNSGKVQGSTLTVLSFRSVRHQTGRGVRWTVAFGTQFQKPHRQFSLELWSKSDAESSISLGIMATVSVMASTTPFDHPKTSPMSLEDKYRGAVVEVRISSFVNRPRNADQHVFSEISL